MGIELDEYKDMLEDLKENKSICAANAEALEYEMLFVSALVKNDINNRELLRFQVKVNDRYFINQEMINILNLTIAYLQKEKDMMIQQNA